MTDQSPTTTRTARLAGIARTAGRVARGIAVPVVVAGLITAGAPGLGDYRIKSGDTLSRIAKQHGTTVQALVKLNDLPGNGHLIYVGEVIKLPGSAKGRSRTSRPAARGGVSYTVKPGETVGVIAKRYKVTQRAVLAANGLTRHSRIYAGRPLRIPVAAGSGGQTSTPPKKKNNTFAGRTYADHIVAAADRNRATLAKRKHPTRAATRSMIIATAKRYGVDPELALAISWQESGWRQRVVSPANAVGTMQVIPSSGRFSSDIIGRRLDLLKARDNITAGVVLLDRLTGAATLPNAIAGYYQGLGSVKRRGMYADTKIYVRNVMLHKNKLEKGWNPAR